MTDDSWPPHVYPVMVQGATFNWSPPPFMDLDTGEPYDWTAQPGRWSMVSEIRDRTGVLLATFDNLGSESADGVITPNADGTLDFYMHWSDTAQVPITRPYTNSTDPRIGMRTHRGTHAMDLAIYDTTGAEGYGGGGFGGGIYGGSTAAEIYIAFYGSLTVQQMVTGGS